MENIMIVLIANLVLMLGIIVLLFLQFVKRSKVEKEILSEIIKLKEFSDNHKTEIIEQNKKNIEVYVKGYASKIVKENKEKVNEIKDELKRMFADVQGSNDAQVRHVKTIIDGAIEDIRQYDNSVKKLFDDLSVQINGVTSASKIINDEHLKQVGEIIERATENIKRFDLSTSKLFDNLSAKINEVTGESKSILGNVKTLNGEYLKQVKNQMTAALETIEEGNNRLYKAITDPLE